jgi:thymidine kinase
MHNHHMRSFPMGIEEVVAITGKPSGWIEVICGSMFSGKTEELIRRMRRAQIAKQKVAIFKPLIDFRYSEDHIVSHNQQKIPSIAVEKADDILKHVKDAQVLGIDEAQFFDERLVAVSKTLASHGRRVIVAGLDKDYRGVPFEPIPQLLCEAEYITKTLAICMKCGNPASYTQRITQSEKRVLLGATDQYEARCRQCFEPPQPGSLE